MFKELAAGTLLLLCTVVKGQSGPQVISVTAKATPTIKALTAGQVVPDFAFNGIINAASSSAKLSDYKGKVVVLDFWATFCTPCIEKMPYVDSIQKMNEDIVKILIISRDNLTEDKDKVSRFLKKYKGKYSNFSLPIVTKDTTASQYFPHKVIPHYVWIDKNGEFLATTSGDELNTDIIRKVYEGKSVDFSIKREFMNFKADVPLFTNGNGGAERNVRYKSIITGRMDGVSGGQYTNLDKNGLASKLFIRNTTLLNLFRKAHNFNLQFSQIILNVKDEKQFIYNKADKDWGNKNIYCYELITAPTSMEKLWKLMQHDMYAYFGMSSKVENRKVKCLVVVRSDDKQPINNEKHPKGKNAEEGENSHSIDELIWTMNDIGRIPVFSGTPSSDTIMLQYIVRNISSLEKAREILHKTGLKLIEEERELPFLVISEE